MNEGPFRHAVDIQAEDLRVEPFHETRRVRDFDCGDRHLNDFLNTDEVVEYEKEYLGYTHLVFLHGDPVAYFTVSLDGLRVEYLKSYKSFSRLSELRLESLPSVKIGRLAVAKAWQNRGLGRLVLKYIVGMALNMGVFRAARLLTVQAKPAAIDFYKQFGFELTYETARERKRANRTMFYDLLYIKDIANE